MIEYIEREKAQDGLDNIDWYHVNDKGQLLPGGKSVIETYVPFKAVEEMLKSIPAADVRPVVMGRYNSARENGGNRMSGIYIKGMEMPKGNDTVTIIIFPNGKVSLAHDRRFAEYAEAVPVPPHGRLIDAEPIMKYITDGLNSADLGYDAIKVMTEIEYAPTIIPAEEGE